MKFAYLKLKTAVSWPAFLNFGAGYGIHRCRFAVSQQSAAQQLSAVAQPTAFSTFAHILIRIYWFSPQVQRI